MLKPISTNNTVLTSCYRGSASTRNNSFVLHSSEWIQGMQNASSHSKHITRVATRSTSQNQQSPIKSHRIKTTLIKPIKPTTMLLIFPPANTSMSNEISFWHKLGLILCTLFPIYYISYNVHPAFGVHREAFGEWSALKKGW